MSINDFDRQEIEYPVYWVASKVIQLIPNKVQAIVNLKQQTMINK